MPSNGFDIPLEWRVPSSGYGVAGYGAPTRRRANTAFDPEEDFALQDEIGAGGYARDIPYTRQRQSAEPQFDLGDPNFDAAAAARELLRPKADEQNARAKWYQERGVSVVRDANGRAVPRGTRMLDDGIADLASVAEQDQQLEEMPTLREAAAAKQAQLREAAAAKAAERARIAEENKLRTNARSEASFRAKELKAFTKSEEAADLDMLEVTVPMDEKTSQKRLGPFRAAFDLDRETGDFSPEAERAQARLAENKSRLEALRQKKERLQRAADESKALSDKLMSDYHEQIATKLGLRREQVAPALEDDPEDPAAEPMIGGVPASEVATLYGAGRPAGDLGVGQDLHKINQRLAQLEPGVFDKAAAWVTGGQAVGDLENAGELMKPSLIAERDMLKALRDQKQKQIDAIPVKERVKSGLGALASGIAENAAGVADWVAVTAKRLDQNLPEGWQSYDGKKVDDLAMAKLAKVIRDQVAEFAPQDPMLAEEFWSSKVPQAVGSMLGMMGPGIALKSRYIVPLVLGGTVQGADGYRDAVANGATEDQAWNSLLLNTGVGFSEIVPVSRMLERLSKASGGGIKRALIDGGIEAFEEAVQEFGQQVGGNWIARELYDKERDYFEGAGDNAAVGGVTGALTSLVMSALGGRGGGRGKRKTGPAEDGTPPSESGETPPPTPTTDEEFSAEKKRAGKPITADDVSATEPAATTEAETPTESETETEEEPASKAFEVTDRRTRKTHIIEAADLGEAIDEARTRGIDPAGVRETEVAPSEEASPTDAGEEAPPQEEIVAQPEKKTDTRKAEPTTENPESPSAEEPAPEPDLQPPADEAGGDVSGVERPVVERRPAVAPAKEEPVRSNEETESGSQLPENWQVTVQQPEGDIPGYVQIDVIDENGESGGSFAPEELERVGYDVPDFSEVPTGRHKVGDLKKSKPGIVAREAGADAATEAPADVTEPATPAATSAAEDDEVASEPTAREAGETNTAETIEGEKIDREWTAFAPESQSLGIPRAEMPQIASEHRGALVQFLKAREVAAKGEEIVPTELKPTQAEYSPAKVEKAQNFEGQQRPILISSDNHVVDGHHQWVAALEDKPDEPIKVIRLDAPIAELLPMVREFPSAETAKGATPAKPLNPESAQGTEPTTPTAAGRAPENSILPPAAEGDQPQPTLPQPSAAGPAVPIPGRKVPVAPIIPPSVQGQEYEGLPVDKPAAELTDEELAIIEKPASAAVEKRNYQLGQFQSDPRFFTPIKPGEVGHQPRAPEAYQAVRTDFKAVRDYLRDGTLTPRGEQVQAIADKILARAPGMAERAAVRTAEMVRIAVERKVFNDALHPSNKNARAVFTELTGVKLPGTIVGTKAAVEKWAAQAAAATTEAKPILPPETPTAPALPTSPTKQTVAGLHADISKKFNVTKRGQRALRTVLQRLNTANPTAFEGLQVVYREGLPGRLKGSPAAYDPTNNVLYLDTKDAGNQDMGIVQTVVHEAGHFAEKFYLGEAFTQGEWEKLTDEQRSESWRQYGGETRSGAELKTDRVARSEWVSFQFARLIRGDVKDMQPTVVQKLRVMLDDFRTMVKEWYGDEKLSTPALDAKILEMLGYDDKGARAAGQTTLETTPPVAGAAATITQPVEAGKPRPETVVPANDRIVGTSAAGETIRERQDGSRYRLRLDRKDRPAGYPDFGGDLSAVTTPTAKPPTTESKPSAPAATPSRLSAKAQQEMRDAFEGLAAPNNLTQVGIPREKRAAFGNLADTLLDAGINTPEAVAEEVHKIVGERGRKYSQAVWDSMTAVRPELRGTHDWAKHYEKFDAPVTEAEPAATPEPAAAVLKPTDRVAKFVKDTLNSGGTLTRQDLAKVVPAGAIVSPKQIDEAAELGIVRAARKIAARTDLTPVQKFDEMVNLYVRQPNLTAKTSTSKINQAYSTPAPIAYLGHVLADLGSGKSVVESSTGNGMLVHGVDPKNTQTNEIDPVRRANLVAQGFAPTAMDASTKEFGDSLKPADRLTINPPFGAFKDEGESRKFPLYIEGSNLETTSIDQSIAMNSLRALTPDGKAVLILGAGSGKAVNESDRAKAFIAGTKQAFYYNLYRKFNVTDHFTIDGDLYGKQGAGWPIDVITIDGRGKSGLPFPWVKAPAYFTSWDELRSKVEQHGRGTRDAGAAAGAGGEAPLPRPAGERGGSGAGVSAGKPAAVGGARGGDSGSAGGSAVERPAGTQPEPVREPADVGGNPEGGGAVSGQSGRVAERELPATEGAAASRPGVTIETNETGFQATYTARSGSPQATLALTPKNLVTPTSHALAAVEGRRGNIDDFVTKELGYASRAELYRHLDGGQVDAVALALDNIKRGGALITGDQTGMGKGRTVAAILRYAVRQGITPVFVTKNPGLYADMLRDLEDIGSGNIRPFLTNSDERVALEDANGVVVKEFRSAKAKEQKALIDEATRTGILPGGAKVIFTSYDQIKSDWADGYKEKPKEAMKRKKDRLPKPDGRRMRFLRKFANKGFVLLDESHLAGGESDTGWRVTQMISGRDEKWEGQGATRPAGLYYSSATFAKAPKNMGVYFETNVKRAVESPKALADMMEKGGVPMQQVLTGMLARDGQYIRRELDFSGIEFRTRYTDDTPTGKNAAKAAREKKLADSYTEPLREIIDFNRDVLKMVEELNDALAQEGIKTDDGKTLADQLSGVNFGDQIHNMVRQYLLAIKADSIAEDAVAALKGGHSPVIAVHNTMESVLGDLQTGGYPPNFDGLLYRYLDKALEVTIKTPDGSKQKKRINLDDLRRSFPQIENVPAAAVTKAAQLKRHLEVIKGMITEESRADIPVSPIDRIRHKIEEAGFKFGEISGRQAYLDREGQVRKRNAEDATKAGQNKILARFNRDGQTALLLTVSGSTGISAHASEKFRNQQPRVMIVGQILPDINDMIQMFGRVFRKGQVVKPGYIILNTTIPAEKRLSAILSLKMASLNANTTSSGEGVNSGASGGVDFINKYGDEVVYGYLEDHPEVVAVLRNTFGDGQLPSLEDLKEGDWYGTGDFTRAVTGEIAVLPYDEQAAFYSHVLTEYQAKIDFLNEVGENDLVAQNLPLEAETLEKRVLFRSEGDSEFDGPAYLETVRVKSSKKPIDAKELPDMAEKSRAEVESAKEKFKDDSRAEMDKELEALREKHGAKAEFGEIKAKAELRMGRAMGQVMRAFDLFGRPVIYTAGDNSQAVGYVTNVIYDPEKPLTPSAHKLVVHINTEQQKVTLPVSQVAKLEGFGGYNWQQNYTNLANISTVKRIVTGNLIGGFEAVQKMDASGRVITYTTKDGEMTQGILMPGKFNPTTAIQKVESGTALVSALRAGQAVTSAGGAEFAFHRGEIEVRVPASKRAGGKYWQDQRVLGLIAGGEMRQVGSQMVGSVPETKADALVQVFNKDLEDGLAFFDKPEDKKPGSDALGAPKRGEAKAEELDDSVADSIEFEDAPADYANRPDIRDRISSFFGKQATGVALKIHRSGAESSGATGDAGQIMSRLENAFGKRILFFEKAGINWGAATHPQYPNTILVNVAAGAPFLNLVGHELTHNMEKQAPALYAELRGAIERMAPIPAAFAADKRTQNYTDDRIPNEWVGDVVGQRMGDPAFWADVRRELEKGAAPKRPGVIGDLVEVAQAWLAKLKERLALMLFPTHDFVTQAEQLHGVIARVMTTYADNAPYPELAQSGDLELSTPEREKNMPAWVREEMKNRGLDPNRPLNDIDVANPSVREAVENDPTLTAEQKKNTLATGSPDTLGAPKRVKGSAEQEKIINRVTGSLEKSAIDRARDAVAELTDRMGTKLRQGLVDQFASIHELERRRLGKDVRLDASVSAWKWALLTQNLGSVMGQVLNRTAIAYKAGSVELRPDVKGIVPILKDIINSGRLRLWEGYAAAYRAQRLLKEGKEHNFGRHTDPVTGVDTWSEAEAQRQIDELLKLATEHPDFETARQEYAKFNEALLDFAQAAGLIDPKKRALWANSDYVPFYRIVEELEGAKGPGKKRGLSGQDAGIRQLKGGAASVAILENIVRNVETMLDASFKNIAMQRVADLAKDNPDVIQRIPFQAVPFRASVEELKAALEKEGFDVARFSDEEVSQVINLWRMRAPKGANIVSVMVGGKPQYYRVKDPLLLRSILSMGPKEYGTFMKILSGARSLLTHAITLDPAFGAANLIRDSFHTWVVADAKLKPGIDSMKGFAKAFAESEALQQIMAGGGGSGTYHPTSPDQVRKQVTKLARQQDASFAATVLDSPAKVLRTLLKISRASENANRVAVHDAVKKGGGTNAEAVFQAMDLMNFTMKGDFALIRFLNDTVPFFNARLQGLYRMGRGAKYNPARFATHGALITAATIALLHAHWDDDRYWSLPEWDRDAYYHFWMGDEHFRIPKPFEAGAIFSTIPERLLAYLHRDGDLALFGKRLAAMFADTFAMNPIPQAFRPMAEQAANRIFFTGSPIVSRGDEFKSPEAQFGPNTSASMRELAEAMPDSAPAWLRSPKRLEAAWRGYLGTLGSYALDASDTLVRNALQYPERSKREAQDFPVLQRFWRSDDSAKTKYYEQFYALYDEVGEVQRRIKELEASGRKPDAAVLKAENREILSMANKVKETATALQDMRKAQRAIAENRVMTPEAKRQQFDLITAKENAATRRVVESDPRRKKLAPVFDLP